MLSLVIQHIDFQNVHVEFSNIKNYAYCEGLFTKCEINTHKEKNGNWF